MSTSILDDSNAFSEILFAKMKLVNAGIVKMALYEFRYALDNLYPDGGWPGIQLDEQEAILRRVNDREFYKNIQIKPQVNNRIVLDENISHLTNLLFVGLVTGDYPPEWINKHFFFDVRGFFFLHRTRYFTEEIIKHLGGQPFQQFEKKQASFETCQGIGYPDFQEANAELDALFIESVKKLITTRGTPILLAIAGPTAAGKTEIVERLRSAFNQLGRQVTSIELDNFLTDRDYREANGIHSEGKRALHFELFRRSLENIVQGKKISIPRYDFVYATSSHDLEGNLKPEGVPIEIEPADIIFIEGNFPFLLEEVVHLIGIKVVYLTDDPIRLKRKWKRDMDYRKKYEPTYFRNRFFKDQFIMAEIAYRPQMAVCDMVVDTTGAALWVTPEISKILKQV
jgi:uridine kinase